MRRVAGLAVTLPVAAFQAPEGCSFAPRCRYARPRCAAERPALSPLGQGLVACLRAEELRSGGFLAHGGAADHG